MIKIAIPPMQLECFLLKNHILDPNTYTGRLSYNKGIVTVDDNIVPGTILLEYDLISHVTKQIQPNLSVVDLNLIKFSNKSDADWLIVGSLNELLPGGFENIITVICKLRGPHRGFSMGKYGIELFDEP